MIGFLAGAAHNYFLFGHRVCSVSIKSSIYTGMSSRSSLRSRRLNRKSSETTNLKIATSFSPVVCDAMSFQLYVMWLPLILNTALPLALLFTLNSFIYARLATVNNPCSLFLLFFRLFTFSSILKQQERCYTTLYYTIL